MKSSVFIFLILLLAFPNLICAQYRQQNSRLSGNRTYGSFPFRKKPTKEQKKQLQANAEDQSKYAQLLTQQNTGIFKLLPDAGCEENPLVIKADENCLNIIPGSSFYSFREDEHTTETLADIRLKNGFLVSDGILSQGILVNLGDVAIERVSLNSEGLHYLRNYQPQELSKEANKQHLQMMRGVKSGKYEYRKIQSAVENSTYALRVIAYRGNIIRSFRGYHYDLLGGDKRIDLTIAFRVVRKEDDGSLTLVWKQLERRESPKLKYQRKKQVKNER